MCHGPTSWREENYFFFPPDFLAVDFFDPPDDFFAVDFFVAMALTSFLEDRLYETGRGVVNAFFWLPFALSR